MIEDIFSVFLAMVGIICVIILTYYASKWYARRMGTIAEMCIRDRASIIRETFERGRDPIR